jgi:hypothetical protein
MCPVDKGVRVLSFFVTTYRGGDLGNAPPFREDIITTNIVRVPVGDVKEYRTAMCILSKSYSTLAMHESVQR